MGPSPRSQHALAYDRERQVVVLFGGGRRVFEAAARDHARRLVAAGELPGDLVVGRWWASSGEACEVDVLGLRGRRTALLGEARWQTAPLGLRDLVRLATKARQTPRPYQEPLLALWGRGGVTPEVEQAGGLGFSGADVVDG